MRKHKRLWSVLISVGVILLVIIIAFTAYVNDYYRADEEAIAAMQSGVTTGDFTVFDGGGDVGFVFYPGGKVEAAAYAPLMKQLAGAGITCVLVEMPFQLAVFDADAWEEAILCAPEVKTWYIGGHSLGGAMASSADPEVFQGLVLLAAYPTDTVKMPVLSIYGTQDRVLDMDAYQQGQKYITVQHEVIIEGGNHAGFGSYGTQDGDGRAAISRGQQLRETVEAMVSFMLEA